MIYGCGFVFVGHAPGFGYCSSVADSGLAGPHGLHGNFVFLGHRGGSLLFVELYSHSRLCCGRLQIIFCVFCLVRFYCVTAYLKYAVVELVLDEFPRPTFGL